jgi:hypothetical protein
MSNSNRDEFSERTRRKLCERVGGRCSRPDCRKPTTGPKNDSDEAVRLGRAAHITAAAENGPRFDANLTPAQRRHFDNGIWLCPDHAAEVDADDSRYTGEELRRWKAEAEARAHEEIGRPLPAKSDAIDQAIALLGRAPERFLPDAIANTHMAVAATLHTLDPNVDIETEFVGGRARYFLSPKQPVTITFTGRGTAGKILTDAVSRVLRDGADVTIPMDGISVEGSKAFEVLLRDSETLTVGAVPSEAVIRIGCPAEEHLVVELRGEARMGDEATTVSAEAFGGIVRTELLWPYAATGPARHWNVRYDFAPWDNMSLADLPHFERAHRLAKALAAGARTTLELEIDGQRMFETTSTGPLDPAAFERVAAMFAYIADARTVVRFAGSTVRARFDSLTGAEAKRLSDMADTIRTIDEPRRLTGDDALSIQVDPEPEIVSALAEPGPHMFRVCAPVHTVQVFQQPVRVPSLTTILSFVDLHLNKRDTRRARKGEPVMLEVTPTEKSMMTSWLA